jgi:hypothetical protein
MPARAWWRQGRPPAPRLSSGNRPGVGRRHSVVATLTSTLITVTIALSVGLAALAAGTRAGRALQRRRER